MLDNSEAQTVSKVRNIIKLQELFHNKFLTVQLLHELISLYTWCIQCTDESQSDIRTYFLQKIQFVLSRPEVQLLLNTANSLNDKQMVCTIRETFRSTERNQMQIHANIQAHTPKFDKKRLYNYDGDKPEQKKKKIDIQLKLMEEMKVNMKNITQDVKLADLKYQQGNVRIQQITSKQNTKLQQRLAKRRNKKLRKRSVDLQNQQLDNKIKKQQLIQAQKQITNTLQRITIRMTKKSSQKQQQKIKNMKGRVNKITRQDSQT